MANLRSAFGVIRVVCGAAFICIGIILLGNSNSQIAQSVIGITGSRVKNAEKLQAANAALSIISTGMKFFEHFR